MITINFPAPARKRADELIAALQINKDKVLNGALQACIIAKANDIDRASEEEARLILDWMRSCEL